MSDSSAGPDWFAPAEPAESDQQAPPSWAELVAREEAERVSAPSADAAPPTLLWPSERAERDGRSGTSNRAASQRKTGFGSQPAKKRPAQPSGQGQQRQGRRQRTQDSDARPAEQPSREKKPLSREKLEARAKNICLYHLGRSMRTRSQLAERLKRKEIPDDVANAVLDRFEELELLDDAKYAEAYVRSRHLERGLAKRALGYELRQRGIDGDVAAEALETLDEDQETATARKLVETRLRATKNLETQVRVRRLVGMLARKGYAPGVAMRVVKEALAEEGERLDAEMLDALDDAGSDGF